MKTKGAAKRKLSEAQAWMVLAKEWDGARPVTWNTAVYVSANDCLGLCESIEHLAIERISLPTCNEMRARLKKHAPRIRYGEYYWPLREEGAKKRAAFCRRMAKLATTKKGGS